RTSFSMNGLNFRDIEWLIEKTQDLITAQHRINRNSDISNDRIKRIQNQRKEINRLIEDNEKLKQQLQLNKDIDEFYQLDQVNQPSHYTTGEIEVIDYINDKLT